MECLDIWSILITDCSYHFMVFVLSFECISWLYNQVWFFFVGSSELTPNKIDFLNLFLCSRFYFKKSPLTLYSVIIGAVVMQLSTKVAEPKATLHPVFVRNIFSDSFAFMQWLAVDVWRVLFKWTGANGKKGTFLCLHQKLAYQTTAIISIFSPAVGTRLLTRQSAWLKQLVVQYNPYLKNVIMY